MATYSYQGKQVIPVERDYEKDSKNMVFICSHIQLSGYTQVKENREHFNIIPVSLYCSVCKKVHRVFITND